mgnify:CR=1 FL=1
MKNLLAPLFSKGILVFGAILTLLNGLSFKYVEGFDSWWLLIVIEVSAVASYIIAMNVTDHSNNVWGK